MKHLLIISLILLSSCVSTKIPTNERKAAKNLGKALSLVGGITKVYPNLVDSITTGDSISILTTGDTVQILLIPDSVNQFKFFTKYDSILQLKDSLSYLLNTASGETYIQYSNKVKILENLLAESRKSLPKILYPDTTFTVKQQTKLKIQKDSVNLDVEARVQIDKGDIKIKIIIPPQNLKSQITYRSANFKIQRFDTLEIIMAVSVGIGLYLITKLIERRKNRKL